MKVIKKIYTCFEICEENLHRHSKKHIDLQGQPIYDDKKDSKKNLHILENGASGVPISDIEQAIV